MAECVRCGAFTDLPAETEYHYCDDCNSEFADVRENGIVIQQHPQGEGYEIHVPSGVSSDGGSEPTQVEALARGKSLADELGLDALFEYRETGSNWMLEEYLRAHPDIRRMVSKRLSRAPDSSGESLLERLREFL